MMITSAITISIILRPMAAKAMEIIKDKGFASGRYIAGTAVDKVTGRAIDNAIDMVVNKVCGIVNIERDISNLQTTLRMIEDILQVADKKQIDTEFTRDWLQELVDIGYEARDVLDDFITFSSCVIREGEASNPVNFISSLIMKYFGGSSSDTSKLPLAILNRLANDIKSVRVRFDDMTKKGEAFTKLKAVVGGGGSESFREYRRQEVGPFIKKQRDALFLGREEMKRWIMEKILHPEYDSVDVVAIWGMGGIGKTTLALSIYNDERVKEHYPTENRSWLCVGETKFIAEKVIREIVNDEKITGIENLQKELVKKFNGNRFLIVLDDVWDVDGSEWDKLFNPLDNVGKGGLIIITTRKRGVCTVTNTQTTYDLKPLSEEHSWSIFESCAYVDGKSDSTPDLKRIGKKIVKKLNGHPLALKVVGRSLLGEDSSTWTNFLESKLTKDDEVMSALRWSYNHLPRHLKMCFTYCALFPKDHIFYDEKELVEMWMAHDLIQINENERPEVIGAKYFKELTYASLFQCVDETYVMHDMVHDLALHVSNEEFSSAVGSLSTDLMKKVRHITITNDDEYSKNLSLCKSKRILTVYTPYKWEWHERSILKKDILLEVFKQSKSLRVLVLCNQGIKEIPECICELKHLRYLHVRGTGVKSLPHSLCQLHNLQMLAAPDDAFLPLDIVNIRSLRYVRANLPTCRRVAKLTSLQELSSIHVCKGDNIRELGDMKQLRRKLTIEGLENVTSSEDAAGALMEKQTLIDELVLKFYKYSAKPTISAKVLDALGCPPNLKCLTIDGYTGVKSPSIRWKAQVLDGKHKFDKLQTLVLLDCPKLESLPPLGEFDKLERLELCNCPKLESLPPLGEFDKLQTLELYDCPKLESLAPLGELTSLKRLSLRDVGVKRLGDEFYGKFTDGKVFFPSLESLSFSFMKEWEEWDDIIIENSSVSFFPRLTRLEIRECAKLVSVLPVVKNPIMNAANFMTSLSRLGIQYCNELKRLQLDALVSLKELNLLVCPKLESLPPLGELTSLKRLSLFSVGVKRLGDEFYGKFTDGKVFFPSLESLRFSMMKEWEEWDDIIIENSSVSFFPRLTRLKILCCWKLVSVLPVVKNPIMNVANFMTSLSSLMITDCKGLKRLQLDALVSLKELTLSFCLKLESLPPLGELTSLKRLSLFSVGVKRLGDEFYGKFTDGKVFFPSLESLCFSYMKEWEEWDDIIIENSNVSFFPRLTRLEIEYCEKLVSVLPVVKNPIMNAANFMTSLSRLEIHYCRGLRSLPADGLPPSLTFLSIEGCPLLYERYNDESGPDRHKINHIPDKDIS